MVYLKSVENVIPLSKLIGLLFLFCLPLLSILFLKTKRNDLARPVMGTIFLVNRMCGILDYVHRKSFHVLFSNIVRDYLFEMLKKSYLNSKNVTKLNKYIWACNVLIVC